MANKFEYKYVAPTEEERKEIEHIRDQYLHKKQKTKIEYLRKLDNKVNNIPIIISLALGVIGVLIFGVGMTMVLEWNLLAWGIIVGAVGCVPMGFAYFAYNLIYKKLKAKYSEEILKISGELLNEDGGKEL